MTKKWYTLIPNTMNNTDSQIENVIIIGGGPAGLAAAVYLSRANLNPLVLAGSPPGGQLTLTSEVENYPGIESILGPELIVKMRAQAQKFGTRIIDENVLKVDLKTPQKLVQTTNKSYQTKSVLIATGAKALWLGLDSETRLRGKGVSACATCDGFFFKEKIVAVVGGGDTAMEEALTLTKFASKVYLLHRRDSFRASKIMQDRVLKDPKVEVIYNIMVEEVLGEMKVEGLTLKNVSDGTTKDLAVGGLFLAIGHKPDTELFKDQINLDEKGYVITAGMLAERVLRGKTTLAPDMIEHFKNLEHFYSTDTSITGVFAAGDNVDHVYRQAATASGMGVAAALDIERWLTNLKS